MPAINPFSTTNKALSESEIDDRLAHYGTPTDAPLVVQVLRFDRWQDPQDVVDAFRIARKQVDATLVLIGNVATDDPDLRRKLGDKARETVQDRSLLTRLMEDWLDLIASFEPHFT